MKNIFFSLSILTAIAISISATKMYETSHKTAEANVYQGVSVFTDCNPVMPYDNLGDVTIKSTGGFGNDTYNAKRQDAINKMKKQYPAADGILISFKENGACNATAIKFKN
jgi:hypothetical protein